MLNSLMNIPDIRHGKQEAYDLFTAVEETIRQREGGVEILDNSSVKYAKKALVEGQKYLALLRVLVLTTADFLRCDDELQANVHIVEMLLGVEWFLKAIHAVEGVLVLDFSTLTFEDKALDHFIEDLHQIVMDMQAAHEKNNGTFLQDILEYELAPQLESWRQIFAMLEQNAGGS